MTSDSTTAEFCGPPVRLCRIRYDADCPVRIASLHEVSAISAAIAAASVIATVTREPQTTFRRPSPFAISPFAIPAFGLPRSPFAIRLPSENPRGDEDEQLAARV